MRTFIKTTQDSSIYERYPTRNTGLDEILEVGKLVKSLDGSGMYASASVRSLLQFDVSTSSPYPATAKYYLNLHIANAQNVDRYQKLEIHLVSQSWTEGSGYFYQDVKNVEDGVTWRQKETSVSWSNAGGDFTSTLTSSYTFNTVPFDNNIRIDVTNLVSPVVSGSNITPWNGFLIKYPTSDEIDSANTGNIKFFSGNTHTVYEPKLEIVWIDQTFSTGSLKPVRSNNVSISPKNLKEAYTSGEIDKVYLIVRDPYPDKRFDATQRYRNQYYLPSQSFFRIKDTVSDVYIQKFDQYSAISCDPTGSYFVLDTTGLDINRYYEIDLKIQSSSLVFFPEFNYTFKVDNNE